MTIDTGILCSVNADTSQGVQAFQNFNAAAATTNATVDAGSQSLLNMGKTMEGMASSLQNLSRSQAVANSESDSWIQNMLGISTPMGMLTKGIDIMKSSWVEAKNAVADYQKYAQQITQGGKVGFADANLEVQAIAASTGNLISLTRIATDQNVLQRNAVKLTNKEMELVYKAAVGLSRQTGQSIEEVSQKLTNSIAKGTSETIMEYGLLSQELTGSKSEKIKVIMGTLETGFSNIGMEAQTMGEKAQRSLNMAEMAAISMGKVLEDNVAKGKAFETSLKENLAVTKGWIISTLTGEDIRLDKQGVLAQAIEQTDNLISGFKELSNYEKGLSFLGEEEVDQFAQLEEITQSMVALRKELAMIKRVTDAGDQLSAIQAEAMLKAIIAEEEKRIKQLKERAILLAEEAKRNPDQQGAEEKRLATKLEIQAVEGRRLTAANALAALEKASIKRMQDDALPSLQKLQEAWSKVNEETGGAAQSAFNYFKGIIGQQKENLKGMVDAIGKGDDKKPGVQSAVDKQIQEIKDAYAVAAKNPELQSAFRSIYGVDVLKNAPQDFKIFEAQYKIYGQNLLGEAIAVAKQIATEKGKAESKLRDQLKKDIEETSKQEKVIMDYLAKEKEEATKKEIEYRKKVLEEQKGLYTKEWEAMTNTEASKYELLLQYEESRKLTGQARYEYDMKLLAKQLDAEKRAIAELLAERQRLMVPSPPANGVDYTEDEQKALKEKLEANQKLIDAGYGKQLNAQKAFNEKEKTIEKAAQEAMTKMKEQYLQAAGSLVTAMGSATMDAMLKSDAALKAEGISRADMLKKALKDELASLAKRAFGQGLWESAQALGALATGNMTSATAHGIAAGAYFALAGTAGVAAKNMSSVVPHKPSETGASSASVAGASTSGGGQIINFYFPNGFVYGDKDTIARVVTESVASAKARGKM